MTRGLARTRRTAALARATMAAVGIVLALTAGGAGLSPLGAAVGFGVILATSVVQWLLPRAGWLTVEESLAPFSAVLIIGLGPEWITPMAVLWLACVASGVLARGGRQHVYGRAVLLGSLALPIAIHGSVTASYGVLCLATIALLLTCGRTTRELRALHDLARYEADHDGLTDLLARTAFRAELDHIAAAVARGRPNQPATALVLVDLDNFGLINKTNGHTAGNATLVAVAGALRGAAGTGGLAGRLGGDEFAVVLRGPTVPALEARARRLLSELASGTPAIPASAGMVFIPDDGHDAEALVRAGDVALRVAKRSGGRQLSVYAGESFSDTGPGGARETLERLIAGEDLSMVVQPIVSVPDGAPHAYEALARFHTGGASSPLHWFSLADELGLRDRLELACLRAALALFAQRPEGCSLSVNLSGPLLLDRRVHALLDEIGPLHGLIIELTENNLLQDTPELHAQITSLLGRGVRFAVDDMGAGYSGLRQITTVRPSYLKLDRSLVSGIDLDPDRGALIAAMVGWAAQTGGQVVAEGVETTAELDALVALRVGLVQGFLLSRPAPPWPGVDLVAVGEQPSTAIDPVGSVVPAPLG